MEPAAEIEEMKESLQRHKASSRLKIAATRRLESIAEEDPRDVRGSLEASFKSPGVRESAVRDKANKDDAELVSVDDKSSDLDL